MSGGGISGHCTKDRCVVGISCVIAVIRQHVVRSYHIRNIIILHFVLLCTILFVMCILSILSLIRVCDYVGIGV